MARLVGREREAGREEEEEEGMTTAVTSFLGASSCNDTHAQRE